jgi:DNA-binding NtrC family response regulator
MNSISLDHKKVLIVDDEADVLETLEELLVMCDITKAQTFEEGKELLENRDFDVVILDIMGVDGYKLLEIAKGRHVVPVMLTAHALSPQYTMKAFKEGAASYIPKDKIQHIVTYLTDVLEANGKGKSSWWRWIERFSEYYDKKFGPGWQESDIEFWEKLGFWE